MRSLSQSVIVALFATVGLYVIFWLSLPATAWFKVFLFERSLTQWVAIGMFVFGLDQLVYRWRLARADRRLLATTNWPGETAASSPSSPTVGWVAPRLATLRELVGHHSPTFTQSAAKSLAEEDEHKLNEAYTLSSDVIGLLPLVGFFGTVLGLSQGLYNNFVLQGEDSTSSFANAIGTAFDTTLLALFLTIVLSILQSLIRRTEQSAIEALDRFVELHLAHATQSAPAAVPASNDPRIWLHELGLDPSELIAFFRARLSHISTDLDQLNRTQSSVPELLQSLEATVRETRADPAVDPSPQLQSIAEHLRQLQSLATADTTQQAALAATAARVEQLLATQGPATLTALKTLQETARAGFAADAAQAKAHTAALTTATTQIATAQTTLQSATQELTSAVRAAAEQTAGALAEHGIHNARQHQATQELLRRPKTFSVTEQPSPDDGTKH